MAHFRRIGIDLVAAAMLVAVIPVVQAGPAEATTDQVSAPAEGRVSVVPRQAMADYFGCRYHRNVLCRGGW